MASEGVTSPSLMPRKKRKSAPNALLTHGSCVDEMRKLCDNSVHMVLSRWSDMAHVGIGWVARPALLVLHRGFALQTTILAPTAVAKD